MDSQPPNLFVRGWNVARLWVLDQPATLYKYPNTRYHAGILKDPHEFHSLPRPIYVTNYRFYSGDEALQALSIPGPAPTHVIEIELAVGSRLQGPAFVPPLSPHQ